jgi:seryl-tRNA synthetase
MLDPKFIRANPDAVREAVRNKLEKVDIDEFLKLDGERRDLLQEADALKQERNTVSEEIARDKKQGGDPRAKIEEMRAVSAKIKNLDGMLKQVEEKIDSVLMWVPNIPHPDVPVGRDENDNQVVREWGSPPEFDFEPRPHWDVAEALDIVDFKRGATVAGSNFVIFKGKGAKLVRALMSFMLDMHIEKHGYREIWPPCLSNRDAMFGTGQLPKLEEDMYHAPVDDFFLIPTGEVPLTNLHRGEILDGEDLPLRYTAYTPCFRREAGSYGKDTRGLQRVHQFDKVELVKLVRPGTSYDELESLVADAEDILQALGLAYRVNMLCTGELSFAAAKCYDLEVFAPAHKRWLEVSSCSNFEDFQARRTGIRFRPARGEKAQFVHTLNGSGVAFPRAIIAILETYQTRDGKVRVPDVLVAYMGGLEVIE